jgi:hypothetical protein
MVIASLPLERLGTVYHDFRECERRNKMSVGGSGWGKYQKVYPELEPFKDN